MSDWYWYWPGPLTGLLYPVHMESSGHGESMAPEEEVTEQDTQPVSQCNTLGRQENSNLIVDNLDLDC